MNQIGIDAFAERWANDGAFRGSFRVDAQSALASHGIELSSEEWAAVQAIAGGSTSLDARVNLERGYDDSGAYC